MKDNQISTIVPTKEAQDKYSDLINELADMGLWLGAKHSWYMGSNIPGKKVQMLQFPGGVPAYATLCNNAAAKDYEGFQLKHLK